MTNKKTMARLRLNRKTIIHLDKRTTHIIGGHETTTATTFGSNGGTSCSGIPTAVCTSYRGCTITA